LTTAKFYSPLDRPYSEQGVQPDIPITVRTVAKPVDGVSIPNDESTTGDPTRDPVLAAAIRTARSKIDNRITNERGGR
jgi:carboxyl-terminal processing protease